MDLGTAMLQQGIRASKVVADDYYAFGGGLNLVDPPYSIKPGECLQARNYEPYTRGGYARVDGFERFDGQAKPSQAQYWILNFTTLTGAFSAGQTVLGGTSAATGIVQAIVLGTPSTTGYLVLELVSGTFSNGEQLKVAGVSQALGNGTATARGAATDALDLTYVLQAIADQRARITQVPGSGRLLGVRLFNGVVYAFRNNAGGTAQAMFKQTTAGWVQVVLNYKLRFTAGRAVIQEGDQIKGATSAVTATAARVVVQTGTWAGGDAAGYIILTAYAGAAFTAAETLNDVTAGTIASATFASNAQQALTNPNGFYEFRTYNFYGNTGRRRMYGVDGQNFGFEYDDTAGMFNQVETGMTVDHPQHLAVFNNQLFYIFAGGSVQMSGVGDAANWTVVLGAAELGIGDDGTGMLEQVSSLIIFGRTRTKVLTGTSRADYQLSDYTQQAGAVAWTIQRIGSGVFLDDAGLSSIQAVADYGDFAVATLSQKILPLVQQEKSLAVSSTINRSKNLYRIFFSDGSGISAGLVGGRVGSNYKVTDNVTGMMPINYGKVVRCCDSEVNTTNNNEELYFGSDDGYVYQNDIGTSFDGQPVLAYLRLAYNFNKDPKRYKRYRQADFQIQANGPATLQYTFDYNFSGGATEGNTVSASAAGGLWDISQWDNFKWDLPFAYAPNTVKLHSSGYNIGVLIYHNMSTENAHQVQGVNLQFSRRRIKRETAG